MRQDLKPLPVNEPVVLAVTGMTCAACAARIEKKLNKIDGVSATVNYATSKATVLHENGSTVVDSLIKTIEDLGYGAVAPKIEEGEYLATWTSVDNEDKNCEKIFWSVLNQINFFEENPNIIESFIVPNTSENLQLEYKFKSSQSLFFQNF